MVNYTYSKLPTINFNTTPASIARSATGSVYAVGDTTYTTPLNMTLVVGGSVVTSISSDANGLLPDFTLLDRTSCVWKQAGVSFATVLTTSDPVPGPQGNPGAVGAPGAQGVPGDVSTWKPTTFYPLNTPVTNPSGDLVKVTTAHTSTGSYDAAKFEATGAAATKLTGVVPDANLRPDLTVAALSATIATEVSTPGKAAKVALDAAFQPKGEKARGWFGRGLVPIASRYARFDFSGASNGTDLATNSRLTYTAHADSLTVRAAWYNAATVPVTIKAGHEDPGGIIRPITFEGEVTKVIQPNQWALSDIINKQTLKGAVSYIRTYMTVTTGQVWHFTHVAGDAGEQVERGASLADKSTSGTLTSVGGATFGPVGLLYQPASRVPSVSGLGDSIMGGTGTSATTAVSFMRKALDGKRSLSIAQRGGETLEAFVSALDAGSAAGKDPLTLSNSRYMLAQAGNWLLGNYGINDIRKPRTAAQIKTDMVGVWTRAATEGQLVTWATLTPNSTSTDAWATVANQSVNSAQNPERVAVNVWLRAGAPIDPTSKLHVAVGTSGALLAGQGGHPLYKVIDVCPAVENTQDSGVWKAPGYTTDGLHPNDLATQAMADTVTAAMAADPKLFS